MNTQDYRDVIYLAGCAVNGVVPDAGRVRAMDLENLYCAANRHMLTAITAMALESAGVDDDRFTQAKGKAIRKLILLDADMKDVFEKMDEAGIWHMPLKGVVMKDLYPRFGMRQMSDRDILFDAARADEVRAIMEGLGFSCEAFGRGAHDVYHKPPVSSFEMHRTLFAPASGEELCDYYRNVRDRLVRDEGNGCGLHFRSEDYYIYMLAHEYKHYANGGTGLRSILDTYVFLRRYTEELDWRYIARETEKIGLQAFEEQNRSLALHLFSGEALTGADQEMLGYIIASGTYGTAQHSVENKVRRLGGRGKYLISRLFMPMEMVKIGYPFFYRHRVLLPALFVYRIGRGLTVSGKKTLWELKYLMSSEKQA